MKADALHFKTFAALSHWLGEDQPKKVTLLAQKVLVGFSSQFKVWYDSKDNLTPDIAIEVLKEIKTTIEESAEYNDLFLLQ